MTDVLSEKIDNCEENGEELLARVNEEHNRLDSQGDNLDRVLRWALEGNGASAEGRLVAVEKKIEVLPEMQETLRVVKLIADAKLQNIEQAIGETLDKRERTMIAKVKAWSPLASSVVAAAAIILVAILR